MYRVTCAPLSVGMFISVSLWCGFHPHIQHS
nr:MAG TPA: hypothetical protein [Caudoviricetes sp.]